MRKTSHRTPDELLLAEGETQPVNCSQVEYYNSHLSRGASRSTRARTREQREAAIRVKNVPTGGRAACARNPAPC